MPNRKIPYRRNFAMALILETFWAIGTWLAHPMTVVPNFLLRLGATPRVVGLPAGLWAVGTGLGSLLIGSITAHRPRLAAFAGRGHYLAILGFVVLALLAFALQRGAAIPGPVWIVLLTLLWFNLLMGALVQVYFVMLARAFPRRGRGAWFGALFAVSSLVALAGPVLAALGFIREDASLADYGRIFSWAAAIFAAGTVPFFFIVEAPARAAPRRSLAENLRRLLALLRSHPLLRRYLAIRFVLEVGGLSFSFLATYARLEGRWSEHAVTWLGMVPVASHAAASFGLGWLAARLERGRGALRALLWVQLLVQAASCAALAAAAAGPASWMPVLLACAAGWRISADFVLQPNILLEAGGRDQLDAMALGAVTLMPAILLVAGGGGLAIEAFGHRPVFAAAAALALPALLALGGLARGAGRATLARS